MKDIDKLFLVFLTFCAVLVTANHLLNPNAESWHDEVFGQDGATESCDEVTYTQVGNVTFAVGNPSKSHKVVNKFGEEMTVIDRYVDSDGHDFAASINSNPEFLDLEHNLTIHIAENATKNVSIWKGGKQIAYIPRGT
jgi:hypothetical protein